MINIQFKPLNEAHFGLMLHWFNSPHVQAFYSLKNWTEEEVSNKLMPYLHHEKQLHGYVIYFEQNPIGYMQSYPVNKHPWENQDLPDGIVEKAAGFDLFIGEKAYLNQDLGKQIVYSFLEEHIWPHYQYCLVDPDMRNEASIRLFRKCGFREHKNVMQKQFQLQLMMKEKNGK